MKHSARSLVIKVSEISRITHYNDNHAGLIIIVTEFCHLSHYSD